MASLDRFKTAQAASPGGFATALAELGAGRKTSHWIWYVFPQLAGLGRSTTAQHYALRDLAEACDHLRDPVLGERLQRAVGVVQAQLRASNPLTVLMGGEIDALKLVSSVTLFRIAAAEIGGREQFVAQCDEILRVAGQQGFPPCAHTLAHARS